MGDQSAGNSGADDRDIARVETGKSSPTQGCDLGNPEGFAGA